MNDAGGTAYFKKATIFGLLFLVTLVGLERGQAAPAQSRAEFCQAVHKPRYFRQLAAESSNQLAFRNRGGFLNKGVCWWHALFQRASLYLAVYRPEKPRPSPREARIIIDSIADGRRVVEVPGYANMNSFSKDWAKEIQAKLEEWQMVDGVLRMRWLDGLQGSPEVPAPELRGKMHALKRRLDESSDIQWVMLQMKGKATHGILFTQMGEEARGLSYTYLDNNFVGTVQKAQFHDGDKTLKLQYPRYGKAVPYPGRFRDLEVFKRAQARYCQGLSAHDIDAETFEESSAFNNDWD
jgi:hypothetical protein